MLKRALRLCNATSLSLGLSLDMPCSVFASDTTESTNEVTHYYSSHTLSKEIEENIRKQFKSANPVSLRMDEYLYEYGNRYDFKIQVLCGSKSFFKWYHI